MNIVILDVEAALWRHPAALALNMDWVLSYNLNMKQASFRFLGELNDFLPQAIKGKTFSYVFEDHQSVKHLIEALGIPHTEVHHILAGGRPVPFSYLVPDGEQMEVYPAQAGDDLFPPQGILQPTLPGEPRFILDNHLGKLAHSLRMLGFDCLYRNDYQDEELAQISAGEGRTLLTRDRRLLMRSIVTSGYCVRDLMPPRQIEEVLQRFDLYAAIRPFQRCIRCNGMLQPVSKAAVLDRLEPLTRRYFDEFRICPECGQVYWKGSHFEHMQQLIRQLSGKNGQPGGEG